jgi:hypothetical protein
MTSPSPLSSYLSSLRGRLHSRNLALALWAVVTLIVVVLIIALNHEPKGGPRSDVSGYITQVNQLSATFTQDYRSIEKAYRTFALSPKKPAAQEKRLQAASAHLTVLRKRMQQIPAPPKAQVLKRRLIAFFRQQEAVSRELIGVSAYVPRLARAEQPLGPAGTTMRAALQKGGTAKEQAAALGDYVTALDRAADAVQAIHPPPLFSTSHVAQVQRLRHTATLTRRLGVALAANDKQGLKRAVKELGAGGSSSAAAARTAILSYNARVMKIRALAATVEKERRRLDNSLG